MKFPAVIKAEADRLFLNVFPFGNVCQGMVESLQDHAFAGMQLEVYLGFAFLLAGLCFPFSPVIGLNSMTLSAGTAKVIQSFTPFPAMRR